MAVLIEGEYINVKGLKEIVVLTIIGHTEEISIAENESPYQSHLKQHPEMESLFYGIDDQMWITADELDSV